MNKIDFEENKNAATYSFSITVSDPGRFNGGICYLCGAALQANVEHRCSGKYVDGKKK